MRFVVYVVAVLAAAGIVYYLSGTTPQIAVNNEAGSEVSTEEAVDNTTPAIDDGAPVVEGDVQLISLKVPSMHCPFACYPSVKKTLEATEGVAEVELAEQKEEGVIDNPVVIIKAGDNFDLDKAIATLSQSGFDGAARVE